MGYLAGCTLAGKSPEYRSPEDSTAQPATELAGV
jgi:hypothetical protein